MREGKAVPTEAEKVHHPEELVELQKAFCRLLAKLKSHQKSEGALSELSESDVQKEVELLKEQYEFLQALITLLPSPMAIVDENGFVRFLNQSASKFFDKAVAGANFAQIGNDSFIGAFGNFESHDSAVELIPRILLVHEIESHSLRYKFIYIRTSFRHFCLFYSQHSEDINIKFTIRKWTK